MTLLDTLCGAESGIDPYYQDPQGDIELYLADSSAFIARIDPSQVALVMIDPPYGVNERTDRGTAGRGKWARANDFPPIAGDDQPFDPTPLLRFPRLVMWGANHYADKLPPSPSWIVWDKLRGLESKRAFGFNDNGDAELAWTNLGGPVRTISHRWMGALRDTERKEKRPHATRKPVALFAPIIERFTEPRAVVADFYCGSGPIAQACKLTGRRYVGFDIDATHLDQAIPRLARPTLAWVDDDD